MMSKRFSGTAGAVRPLSLSTLAPVLLVSAFGLVLGTLSFERTLSEDVRGRVLHYIALDLRTKVGGQISLHKQGEHERLLTGFGERRPAFLIQQWGLRCAGFTVLGALLGLVLHLVIRPRPKDGRRRGTAVRRPSLRDSGLLLDTLLAIAFSTALVTGLHVLVLERRTLFALPDYLLSSFSNASASLTRFFSPDGLGEVGWFDLNGAQAFYAFGDVERHLMNTVYNGRPAIEVLISFLAKVLFLSAIGLFGARRMRAKRAASAIRIAGVSLTPGAECHHFLFSGSPGSGKSTAIKDLLDEIRRRREPAIVYDLSGEYLSLYFRKDHDKLLNPHDARSEPWTLWGEVREKSDYTSLARSLFPAGGHEPFWADASAVLFASCAEKLARKNLSTNEGLYRTLTHGNLSELHDFLQDTPAARLLDAKAGAMPSNLIATVTSRLAPWSMLPDPPKHTSPFTIRGLIEEGRDPWLFLSTSESQRFFMKPLLSLWCDIAANAILSRPEGAGTRIWFILDEIASLQYLPALSGLLERGRKHGACVVLGLQAFPQLRDIYGRDAASALASQTQTWLVLRTVEPETAKWLEDALGATESVETQRTTNIGGLGGEGAISLHEHVAVRPAVLASEIMGLKNLSGFLRLPEGHEVFRVAFPFRKRTPIALPFVPKA